MGYTAAPLEKLIEQFSQFPGIGRKGATRMAYQVLSMSDADATALAEAIQNAHTRLHRCRVCQNYTEAELCPICSSAKATLLYGRPPSRSLATSCRLLIWLPETNGAKWASSCLRIHTRSYGRARMQSSEPVYHLREEKPFPIRIHF